MLSEEKLPLIHIISENCADGIVANPNSINCNTFQTQSCHVSIPYLGPKLCDMGDSTHVVKSP